MSDIDERLDRIEADHAAQRRAWLAKAADHHGFHRPSDAADFLDPDAIATSGDADRAVAALAEQRPYLTEEQITVEEQKGGGAKNYSINGTVPDEERAGRWGGRPAGVGGACLPPARPTRRPRR